MTKSIYSSLLFTNASFLKGAARVMDLQGSLDSYNTKAEGYIADTEALAQDWQMVGNDIATAIQAYESNEK